MNDVPFVTLCTEKCIVTGEPAMVWTGYVVAETLSAARFGMTKFAVIAGFASHEAKDKVAGGPCYGPWKPEYGIVNHREVIR